MKFTLPPDVELSVELDDGSMKDIYLVQGTDVIQVPPKHIGAVVKALYAAETEWRKRQPVRVSTSPLLREPATKGEW